MNQLPVLYEPLGARVETLNTERRCAADISIEDENVDPSVAQSVFFAEESDVRFSLSEFDPADPIGASSSQTAPVESSKALYTSPRPLAGMRCTAYRPADSCTHPTSSRATKKESSVRIRATDSQPCIGYSCRDLLPVVAVADEMPSSLWRTAVLHSADRPEKPSWGESVRNVPGIHSDYKYRASAARLHDHQSPWCRRGFA